MVHHRPSLSCQEPSDLSVIDRRFNTLSALEQQSDTPIEGDLSEVSTLASSQSPSENADSVINNLDPNGLGGSGRSTSATKNPASPSTDGAMLARSSSLSMPFKKEAIKRWTKYLKRVCNTTTKFFDEEVDSHWTSTLIVVCYFVSGVVDSVSYQTFSVFTSLQTGNTIFIALRLSNQPANRHPFAYVKSMTSVGAYCLGGLFFNILHRAPTELSNPHPRLRRWTLCTSFIVQSTLLLISAALAQSGWMSTQPFRAMTFSSGSIRNPDGDNNYLDLIPIGFLAFEAAGQVCLSRVLIVNELPTIVISTLYHDFIGDALSWRHLWKSRKSKRAFLQGQKRQIRRLVCILALFSGAMLGGFVYASPGGIAAALWTAAGIKVIVTGAWCLWKKDVVTA